MVDRFSQYDNLDLARYESITMTPKQFMGLYGVTRREHRDLRRDTYKKYIIDSEFVMLKRSQIYNRWGKWFKCLENILNE